MTQDRNSLPGRVRRYAKVTTRMAGVGVRLAGEKYLGVKTDRQKAAVELRTALGGLKGPLMKVAQLLSTIPDLVPPEYAAELAQLQADAPAMGWPFVKRRMAAELGPERVHPPDEPAGSSCSDIAPWLPRRTGRLDAWSADPTSDTRTSHPGRRPSWSWWQFGRGLLVLLCSDN